MTNLQATSLNLSSVSIPAAILTAPMGVANASKSTRIADSRLLPGKGVWSKKVTGLNGAPGAGFQVDPKMGGKGCLCSAATIL